MTNQNRKQENLNSKNHDPANQCVTCGNEMPEGDHVCKLCRTSRAIYPHGLNIRVTDAQMAAIEQACIQKGMRISEVVRGALDAWMNDRLDRAPGFDSRRET